MMRLSKAVVGASGMVFSLAVGACGGSDGFTPAVVRDSAGITIVENASGEWAEGEAWIARPDHSVDIGVVEGAPEYQLFRVRDALRMNNGRIVIAASNELRFYDQDGRYLFTSGREGGGPGEFQGLGWISPFAGDSIVAYDFNQARVSLLDEDGAFGRSHKITPEGDYFFVMGEGVFSDGTLLVKAPHNFRGGFADGASRGEEEFQTYSNSGEFIGSVGTYVGPDQFIKTGQDGEHAFVAVTTPPFGRSSPLALHGSQFYLGTADSYEIECHAMDGSLAMLIRKNMIPRPVTNADVDRFIEREVADIEDASERESRRSSYDEMPIPETMPAYAEFVVDDLGNLWVEEYEPDSEASSDWSVFAPDGHLLGTVTLTTGLDVKQIGDDFVLGVWRDEFDVEHVRMFGLIKPERDRG